MSTVKPKLTILIQARNEEKLIRPCIQSCVSIADEILVMDMESSDATSTIATQLGARVIPVHNEGFVESVRQRGIDHATHDWILLLDADERVSSKLSKKILDFISAKDIAGYRIPRKNMFLGKWMKYGLQWPDYQVRLFRKENITWPKIIHTQPIVNGTLIDLPPVLENAINHQYRTTIRQSIDKFAQQAAFEQYYESNVHVTERQVFQRIEAEFNWRYFENEGFKDGVRGFILAKLWETYRFFEFAYYAECHKFPEIIDSLQNEDKAELHRQILELRHELRQIKDSKFFFVYGWYEEVKMVLRGFMQ